MEPISEVAVVVPVHDERERVVSALSSIAAAAAHQPLDVLVVAVFDSCTDDSRDLVGAGRFDSMTVECLTTTHRRASSARQVGVSHLADRCDHDLAVLSTDADTLVPLDWISRHVDTLDRGYDAVAGSVLLNTDEHVGIDFGEWEAEYRLLFRSDGTHPHVHAANLSVRLGALRAVGGFGHQHRAEDIDLWRRLEANGQYRLRSDHTIAVSTSPRLAGRVAGGFATALGRYAVAEPDPPTVPAA